MASGREPESRDLAWGPRLPYHLLLHAARHHLLPARAAFRREALQLVTAGRALAGAEVEPQAEADSLRSQYWQRYGTTLAGLMREHDIDPGPYLTEVHDIPLDRLLVETDAPYLAPPPHRGRRNEPSYVVETAKVLAEAKGLSYEALAEATSDNFFRLFNKVPRP